MTRYHALTCDRECPRSSPCYCDCPCHVDTPNGRVNVADL